MTENSPKTKNRRKTERVSPARFYGWICAVHGIKPWEIAERMTEPQIIAYSASASHIENVRMKGVADALSLRLAPALGVKLKDGPPVKK